ncbi:FAD-dependent oxidoreductase [Massilia cavernae]|uniref:FAD-dependent oxidoreductase n=1 Tax=Massilia cavernae TaxID=2320864 RepID=A0A418Y6E9_9BURK|nr:FAD-dependent oxidoreductase [Massilia cavernae]RJG23459.1 FAD-dependent oxidoreductase [Massilia cavernae]
MDIDFQTLAFNFEATRARDSGTLHPVVVVGAGPVGLSTAIDLARQGIPTILLDDDNCLSQGSRAICFSKRTLEIFGRLGCAGPMLDKGVRWNIGKVFLQDQQVYQFDLLPESGHQMPAFINLQQYYVEGYLHAQAQRCEGLDMRWRSRVTGMAQQEDGVALTVATPEGEYTLRAAYVVAADGGRSELRRLMGLESKGRTFKDRFLIADVKMKADFPTERWFWFDPPFHPNQSVLLHRQPDNVWRIDFQLGWDADPVAEKLPERVIPRVQALLGKDTEFTLEWVSVYTFCCLRMDKFRHGRVLFAGDAAHGVSPFGARGANSGVQDADNLAWKLRMVLKGEAPDALLDTYGDEREFAADENILNSTRATDFITPKSAVSRLFRDATLALSRDCGFARALVNSGRLSTPSTYTQSVLNTPDSTRFDGSMAPGAPCADAPVRLDGEADWMLPHLGGSFAAVYFSDGAAPSAGMLEALQSLPQAADGIALKVLMVVPPGANAAKVQGVTVLEDCDGMLRARYDARPGTAYLIRPDQHVCARWRGLDAAQVGEALQRATCRNQQEVHA